jgi:RNA polymerase sigma factor (sigma-70 family)
MLEDYLATLQGVRRLTREEEQALWHSYKKEGHIEARQEIIEHYQLLVFREAVKYPLQETVILDLIQEGTVGLMEAAERYDPDSGVAFSLYALHRIRGRMIDFLRKSRHEVLLDDRDGAGQEDALGEPVPDVAFESADRHALSSAMGKAFERLPEKEQTVLRSVYYGEKTAAETADAMDVSTAYVYRLEKKGIRRLRGMLSHLMHERK